MVLGAYGLGAGRRDPPPNRGTHTHPLDYVALMGIGSGNGLDRAAGSAARS